MTLCVEIGTICHIDVMLKCILGWEIIFAGDVESGVWYRNTSIIIRRPKEIGIVFHIIGREGCVIGVIRDQFNAQPKIMAFSVSKSIGIVQLVSESFVYNIG